MYAQNLINNPSFENYFECPQYQDQLHFCKYWFNPTNETPDYFNTCSKKELGSRVINSGIPYNSLGYQQARSGNAYAGIINFSTQTPTSFRYREFIGTHLQKPLEQGKTYIFGMYVSLADSSKYFNNRFGFCFSEEKDLQSEMGKITEHTIYLCDNSVVVINDSIGKDTTNWHLVQGEYLAKGREEYFIIGLCKGNITKKEYKRVKRKNKTHIGNRPYAYYYIDDVFVEEKK